MNKLVLALAGASALAFGSAAAQASISVTSCNFTTSCSVVNATSSSTIAFSDSNPATSFNESIVFTNNVAGNYSITFGTSSSAINILTATLTSPTGQIYTLTGPTGTLPDKQYNLASTFLPTGSFTFNTTGTRVDGQAGSIAGTLTVVNSAVPEPATWGLMLLGFGGMGFSMRRNRRQSAIAQIA